MRIGLVDRESHHHGGGYERRDEETRSVPAIILDRLQPGRKRPPFVSQAPLQRETPDLASRMSKFHSVVPSNGGGKKKKKTFLLLTK